MLGPVVFDLKVNPQTLSLTTETPFAKHDVVGSAPIREFMGEGDGTFDISGVVFPHHFGGREGLALLETARQGHTPLPFVRGNLVPFGWVLIEKLTIEDKEIGQFGIGMEIGFSASLVKSEGPSIAMAGAILSLFA